MFPLFSYFNVISELILISSNIRKNLTKQTILSWIEFISKEELTYLSFCFYDTNYLIEQLPSHHSKHFLLFSNF